MGSWAQWTAKTALLAAGFAAAAGGLSGVALAAGGQSPASPCGSAAALLGDSTAGCVTAPAPRGLTAERVRRPFGKVPGASGADDTNVPAPSQLAGLGALPGLADLPSRAGLAHMPAPNGVTGGGLPVPGTALSAASTSGMSSDSFAALAVGALLAGVSALKIAGRRARDRKAGFRAMT
jgi:hypothetical protein